MPRKNVAIGLVLSLSILVVWFFIGSIVTKHLLHPSAHLKLIISVGLGEAGIVIALVAGMAKEGNYHISLVGPRDNRWINGLAIPGAFFWNYFVSIVFAIIYLVIMGHKISVPTPKVFDALQTMNPLTLVIVSFVLAALAAIVEEYFFRGYLISRLSRLGIHPLVAGVIAGLLFATFHIPAYGWLVSIPKFLGFGLIAGLYVGWRGRLWPMIIAHFANDFIVFLMMGLLVTHK